MEQAAQTTEQAAARTAAIRFATTSRFTSDFGFATAARFTAILVATEQAA
jgi:hypothetical protein